MIVPGTGWEKISLRTEPNLYHFLNGYGLLPGVLIGASIAVAGRATSATRRGECAIQSTVHVIASAAGQAWTAPFDQVSSLFSRNTLESSMLLTAW